MQRPKPPPTDIAALPHTSRIPIDPSADAPTLFKSTKAFEAWLKKHHATSSGLWLKIAKRGTDEASDTYLEAVEIALCWG